MYNKLAFINMLYSIIHHIMNILCDDININRNIINNK